MTGPGAHARVVRYTVAGGLAASLVLLAPGASAAPPSSSLVATPTSVSLDIGGPTSAPVSVGLDAGCLNVFIHGQAYSVASVSQNTAVATASPDVSPGIHCGDTTSVTVATSAYSANPTAACAAVAASPTTVTFTPVAGPSGIQKKLVGTSIQVTVTNTGGLLCGGGGGGGGGGGSNPAAPAVANAYLNANAALSAACKAAFGNSKSWRGALISSIAGWMPKPESVKDDASLYPDWVGFVQDHVNTVCGYTPV